MAVRIVRLGSPRTPGEGLRIGTVRRPPRGVPKSEYARRDFYDVWLPTVAPSQEAMDMAHAASTPAQWRSFFRRYRSEMKRPDAAHAIALLAALSHQTDFSVGCYCEDEAHCHRHALRALLQAAGAKLAD
ncbi:MAG: DUF488 family protein [Xanthomonadales bacterium]|nr:DUF488 family protein [Xanthomonadales bacterium]MBN8794520.1 DUF488 family protein [Stenotrophomonas nitritireducens]